MDFKVNFEGITIRSFCSNSTKKTDTIQAASMLSQQIGLDLLSRLNLQSKDLSTDCIPYFSQNLYINIDQNFAEKTKLFQSKNSVYVKISPDILKKFIDIKVKDTKFTNGELTGKKELVYYVQEEKVLEFWESTNFSLLILSDEDKIRLELWDKEEEKYKKRQLEIKEGKEKYLQDRKNWILQNGSEYLKQCLELGYKANKEYIVERATIELPDFTVDYNNDIAYNAIVSPSLTGLETIKSLLPAYNAKIVWLTQPIENDYNSFEPCEAVIIENYLGDNTLVKLIE